MKKKIAIAVGVIVVALALFMFFKPTSIDKKVDNLVSDLTSYYLEGDMEIVNGEDVKSYHITSSWMSDESGEYFKVSMLDKSLNQEQIILKNSEGVFVVTPSLNQVFKFQGEWPMNSPKPYLFQTILDVMQGECEVNSQDGNYVVSAPATYPSSSNLVRQDIVLSSDLKPISLIAYNADEQAELSMNFTQVTFNEPFAEGTFDTPKKSMETPTSAYVEDVALPLYPMSVFDSKLVSSTVSAQGDSSSHVLEFSGEKEFTLVQTPVETSSELIYQEIDGVLVEGLGLIGYYDGNRLTVISSQVETSVYSQDLSVDEMLQVVDSMEMPIIK